VTDGVDAPVTGAGAVFSSQIVRWHLQHGRHDLPWQGTRDPYRVWLSEIMLQQTQVATVKAYFERFVQRFPDVVSLAAAAEDEVLGLWSGLGYYARARNLHRCAQNVVSMHAGEFPRDAEALQTLPGIGRSTAAAIASICFSRREAILDANVRRVITRWAAFEGDLARGPHVNALWELANSLLPDAQCAQTDMPLYTQGLMDLGAMLCLPRQPACERCPVSATCRAYAQGNPQKYPVRTRTLKRSSAQLWLLYARNAQDAVFLVKRPGAGIWAGLYCLPVFKSEDDLRSALEPGLHTQLKPEPPFVHVLTHRDLHLHVVGLTLSDNAEIVEKALSGLPGNWVAQADWPSLGLPAPVRLLLQRDA